MTEKKFFLVEPAAFEKWMAGVLEARGFDTNECVPFLHAVCCCADDGGGDAHL
jgi:hypothetical protein